MHDVHHLSVLFHNFFWYELNIATENGEKLKIFSSKDYQSVGSAINFIEPLYCPSLDDEKHIILDAFEESLGDLFKFCTESLAIQVAISFSTDYF